MVSVAEARNEIPGALIRIRDKYPAIRAHKDEWAKIVRLVKQGKDEEAEAHAKAVIDASPKAQVRNRVAVRHRIGRREYLAYQKDMEEKIRGVLGALAARVERMLANNAGEDGKIPLAKINGLLDRLKAANTEAWREILTILTAGVKASIKFGITVTMQSAQDGLNFAKESLEALGFNIDALGIFALTDLAQTAKELAILEGPKKATIARTSTTFQTVFDRVATRRLEKGILKNQVRGTYQTGFSLSRRVWDLRDGHLRQMRNTVASGIAQGRPATAIAKDVKGFTVVGPTASGVATGSGPGVYRSAYKNALRLARSETNIAYHEAEIEYAKAKGYKKMWNVSKGKRTEDICDELAGNIYEAEDVPALPHPNCSCYLTTVIPGIG